MKIRAAAPPDCLAETARSAHFVSVKTSTPKARAFLEACTLTSREVRAIIADNTGRRDLIGVAAAVQFASFPVWFGPALVSGLQLMASCITR